ncbi:MAG: hypothetical protein QOJ51_6968 [Acidobacteriaceae bacterium]|nr:hypothetical protein [Acidobacteriaceae bacterium]
MSDPNMIRELTESAQAMGAIAGNEDRFRAVVDAFRAKDADTFQRLLSEFKILERCERVCHWLRSKECVLLCLELCGPPLEVELPDPREFAQLTAKITADEELVERLANVVEERDAEGFKALVSELKIERFCHLLCHWVCTVYYRLICEIVCSPERPHRIALVDELTQAGAAIGKLAANEKVFAAAVKAALSSNCDALRGAVEQAGLSGHCRFICEWFCTFRCIRVCLLLCRRFPLERIESPLSEAFEFARASASLVAEPAVLERLTNAVEASNAEAFQAIVDERRLGRFCIQLCHWICFYHCRRFCFCVCPPRSAAYFIKVGQYEYSEVYPTGGTTPKIESQIGGSGLTSDTRAFFGTLRLNGGFSLQTGAPQMEYRFETIPTDAAGHPTAPNWQPVLADGEQTIIGYTITSGPVFTPVVASLDAGGWIPVPLASPSYAPTGDLLHLDTLKLSNPPHLDQTGVVAGAHSSHPLAQDVYFGIRMRVRNVGNPGSEFDAGTCHHIAIDNTLYDNVTHQPAWRNLTDAPGDLAVYLVDIQELLGPHGCEQITDQLHVLFTAAHPNLGSVSLTMDGPGAPIGGYAFTLTPDGASSSVDFFGTASPNGFVVKNLKPCAYLVTLTVNVSLTDGDNNAGSLTDQIAFCKK